MRIEKNVILQVAHDIFLKKGYKKTNISEIATKAKIAAGTFYNYFDSKESLFLEIFCNIHNISSSVPSFLSDYFGKTLHPVFARLYHIPIQKTI